jgi:hypothetical protein
MESQNIGELTVNELLELLKEQGLTEEIVKSFEGK